MSAAPRGQRDDEIRFLEDQEQRLLAIADELDSAGLGGPAQAVFRAAEKVTELTLQALDRP